MKMTEQNLPTEYEALAWVETRVSSTKQQREGESHGVQAASCKNKVVQLKAALVGVWETTISGRKEDRENFEDILRSIDKHKNDPRKKYYVCYAIDRFTRAGSFTYEQMRRELENRGVEMVDVQGIIQPAKNSMEDLGVEYDWSKHRPSKNNELYEANKAQDIVRENLTRMIGQAIRNRRQGYAVRAPHDGYRNKYVWVYENGKRTKKSVSEYDTERSKFYVTMGELLEAGHSDEEVAARINAMGFLTKKYNLWDKQGKTPVGTRGGLPLTAKHLQEIKQRTALCAVNYDDTWMLGSGVKAKWKGLWTIQQYNKINKGKWYIEETDTDEVIVRKNYDPETRLQENPLYPYQFLPCPMCRDRGVEKPFKGSASRSKSGNHVPYYHCERHHKRPGVNKYKFEEQVEAFLYSLSFDTTLWESFKLVLTDRFNEKQAAATEAAADMGRHVADLKARKADATRAFIAANATGDDGLKVAIQEEIKSLQQQEQAAMGQRETLEVTERDLEDFIANVQWVMEHPAEFLLSAQNKAQRQAYWSLVFAELPTYHDVIGGTPKLSWIFNTEKDSNDTENDLVELYNSARTFFERN